MPYRARGEENCESEHGRLDLALPDSALLHTLRTSGQLWLVARLLLAPGYGRHRAIRQLKAVEIAAGPRVRDSAEKQGHEPD